MKCHLPTLNSLRAVEAAAWWGSFKDAAGELSVTPTLISHQVLSLEGQLGVQHFERFNRRVKLTPEGRVYAATLSRAFDDINDVTGQLRPDSRDDAGPRRLVIVGNPGFIDCWLHAHLIRFWQKNLDVSLELIPDDVREHQLRNQADIAIHHGFAPPQAFASDTFRQQHSFLFAILNCWTAPMLSNCRPILSGTRFCMKAQHSPGHVG